MIFFNTLIPKASHIQSDYKKKQLQAFLPSTNPAYHLNDMITVVAIPAYQPQPILLDLVDQLLQAREDLHVIIVDDGSSEEHSAIFAKLSGNERVTLLRHAVNMGKGQALKTAFNHYLLHMAIEAGGIITADADGQHKVNDILHLIDTLASKPKALCLGMRTFGQGVPFRSRLGNTVTNKIFRFLIGKKISDTQTGLRALPNPFVKSIMTISSMGYEFELEMLIQAAKDGVPIHEVPIQTIYESGNKSSHFNILLDSLKIYFVFLRFSALALSTAFLDYLAFSTLFLLDYSVLQSIIAARIVAGSYNFLLGKTFVFHSKGKILIEFAKYSFTVIALMLVSYHMIMLMHDVWGLNVVLSKALVEGTLFFISFTVLNTFVFRRHTDSI